MDNSKNSIIMKNMTFAISIMLIIVLTGFLIFLFFPQLYSMLISAKESPCKYPLPQEYQGICSDSSTGDRVSDILDCGCAKMRASVFFIDICMLVLAILIAAIVFIRQKSMNSKKREL